MLAIVSVFPVGRGTAMSKIVSQAIDVIDKSGLDYRLTSMGTIVEGEWGRVMKLVKKIRDRILKDSDRVFITITIDEKKDRRRRIDSKIASVEARLGKVLKK